MDEVLEVMRETTRGQLVIDQRKKVTSLHLLTFAGHLTDNSEQVHLEIRHSQLLALTSEIDDRLRLRILSIQVPALEAVQSMLEESEAEIKAHRQLGIQELEEAIIRERERKRKLAEARGKKEDRTNKKKGKGKAQDPDDISSSDEDSEAGSDSEDESGVENSADIFEDDEAKKRSKAWQKRWRWWHKTEKGKEWSRHHSALILRRRENMILAHKIQLLLGDTYFQLKQEEQEKRHYDDAEQTRVKLLAGKII